ncbi:MAG TPA: acyl-CoA thioesterase [Anaeromyxobacteraceae bacterium]|nr:acyl-CoA thioesterase [Anaeromyxobacteraceae bacterium]
MSAFERHFTIRWSDVDANGHMRNTAYSELCSDTRVAMLAALGFPWERFEALALGPVLLRETIVYRREAALGEDVRVDARVAGLSPDGARWRIRHRLFKSDGLPMARITVLCAWIGFAARRLVVPPAELALALASLERTGAFRELPLLRR